MSVRTRQVSSPPPVSRQTTTPATTARRQTTSAATATPQEAATRRAELSTAGAMTRARLTSGLIYDGTRPAPGTTNTNAARPIDAPLKGDPNHRTPETYNNVINQFAVAHNPRYAIRDSSGDGIKDTFCNIFVWDVTRAMGAEIPHWVDKRTGQPTTVYNYSQSRELDANATMDWLRQHGAQHGWRRVSAEEAQRLANEGHPTMVGWKNPGGIGHVAIVRPGNINERGPAIAQAGSTNVNYAHVRDTFGSRPVEYWVNDRGRAAGGSSPAPTPTPQPPAPTPPPATPPSTTPPTTGLPQATLRQGDRGEAVRALQQSLIRLGYMTEAAYNTGPGVFGPRTDAALRAFQRDAGITVDGIYGPQTRQALTQALARVQGGGSTYTVRPGDTLSQIAQRHGTTVDELVRLNNIRNPNLIYPGQELRLPARTYTVRPGDTLSQIAQRHGTTVDELVRLNNIRNPNLIYPGQELRLPPSSSAPAPAPRPAPTPAPNPGPPPSGVGGSAPIGQIPRTGNAFIDSIAADAIRNQRETGVPASVTIAQAILESGWGRSELSRQANNFFGIKGTGPAGSVTMRTREVINGRDVYVNAQFRKYHTPQESFADHARLFTQSPRYAEAMRHTHDAFRFAAEIHRAGYATDPEYTNKLHSLMRQYNLTQFDAIARGQS
ncbi:MULTISPECIES: LysM peptidoglycan-binding domain-containing protein [Chloracidobacterium]|nr:MULTISPECIES: LysM peptidoglycan-binding domain-containing protein [Chloracidobacterium]QUV80208.1 LysM peptidoglycan-binding domain-containing protein [Chloracidobacterium thermophilum]QUV83258.1 LysM peptidoglycan-binding domain-containing protein [Chloracidobacterium sp. D]